MKTKHLLPVLASLSLLCYGGMAQDETEQRIHVTGYINAVAEYSDCINLKKDWAVGLSEVGFLANYKPVDKLDLSIGTVDAFQGREFKVVYLATTYSIGERDMNPFEKCRLNDNNLLCVALSRQENLLIVVGNKDDYRHENAKKYVPSLYEVNRICNGG